MKAKNDDKGAGQRQLRVGEAIRHALSDIMRRGHFRDPDLRRANVSITEVRVSPDLKNATAYVMPLAADPEQTTICVTALNRAAPFIRGELAKVVELRTAPAVKFEADTSLDYARHIDVLLKQHVPD
jgi:ribosome-binding factor A